LKPLLKRYILYMGDFDLGRITRLKGAVASTADVSEVKPDDAVSLVDGYRRLREQVASLVADTDLRDEFEEMFPDLPEFVAQSPTGGRGLIEWHNRATTEAKKAQRLLSQMSGWLEGVIESQTMPERIQAEAAEKAKLERGFDSV
jgi:hypothetical protein